jgi:DNA-binding MarR family transcriptional regulator
VAGLLSRGWADSQDAVISLTETGEAQFGLVTAKIAELRQDLAAGISPEEYRATIDVLVRMVANLESDAGSR